MKYNNVIFYNHYHNGDVHFSRQFVKDIMSKIDADKYSYAHGNHKDILKDIPLEHTILLPIMEKNRQVTIIGDDVYINTWVGQIPDYLITECTLYTNYKIYTKIYEILNIKLEDIEYYIPTIDFNKVEKNNIDNFINTNNKKILFCNGLTNSGQAINFRFNPIINALSLKYSNITFILTSLHEGRLNNSNILYTNDLIQLYPDLNEIVYLSTYCDIIVGRSSGPSSFVQVRENLYNEQKIFIDFNNKYEHVIWYGHMGEKPKNYCNFVWGGENPDENRILSVLYQEIQKINN